MAVPLLQQTIAAITLRNFHKAHLIANPVAEMAVRSGLYDSAVMKGVLFE